jgi:arylsulfatase A-like enzyme
MLARIRAWQWLLLIPSLALAACGDALDPADDSPPPVANKKPSVILVSIDSLRADHCTPYGYMPHFAPDQQTTPFLNQLAAEGMLFENASAASPWTLPSHISLFTAQSPREHGVRLGRLMLPHGTSNLASQFDQAGYQTIGVFSAPFLHAAYGYGPGFDVYQPAEEYLQEGANIDAITNPKLKQMMEVHGLADSAYGNAPRVNEMALHYLEDAASKEEPFFLFLHYWDVHYNYVPPLEQAKRFLPDHSDTDAALGENFTPPHGDQVAKQYSTDQLNRVKALYDAEIRSVDDALAELDAKLKELGITDEVIFCVISDHGDHFGEEHEGKTHMFHHRTLYEEVMHVPVIIRAPGNAPAGKRVAGTIGLYDVGPTLLDLAGLPEWTGRNGRSARPLWEQNEADFDVHMDLLHPGEPTDSQGWRRGPFKVMWEHGWVNPRNGQQLRGESLRAFNLAQDPTEIQPMTELNDHAQAQAAVGAMTALANGMPLAPTMEKLPDEVNQALQDTGYADSLDLPEKDGE